jgi:thioredoxin reductase
MQQPWECIVVGGGAAGLSAALVLGRARRRTLVIDAGRPSNGVAEGIGGLLGYDRRPPSELYAAGHGELAAYPSVEVRTGDVVAGRRADGGFVLDLADGTREAAARLVLATGMDYRYPDIPGIVERWGRSVFHCPFCHGWEHREGPVGVLGRGTMGAQRAVFLGTWNDDVTLYTDGPPELGPADEERLAAARVTVEDRRVTGLRGPGSSLEAVLLGEAGERPCGGLLVHTTLHQRSPLAEQLGAALTAGPLAADAIVVDAFCRTTVPGVYAAGDLTTDSPSVANAVASGSNAASSLVRDLTLQA